MNDQTEASTALVVGTWTGREQAFQLKPISQCRCFSSLRFRWASAAFSWLYHDDKKRAARSRPFSSQIRWGRIRRCVAIASAAAINGRGYLSSSRPFPASQARKGFMRHGCFLCYFFIVAMAQSQTVIDLRTQTKSVDFSAATATKPSKTGAVLPATCLSGELFFQLNAPAGANLYGCSSTNTWSVETASSTSASLLTDFQTALVSSTILSIGATCSASSPCNVRFGTVVYSFTAGATATISGGTGTAYVYVSSSGVLTVGHTMTVSCGGPCVAQSGISAFPVNSLPLFIWSATSGQWAATGTNARAFLSGKTITAGAGLTATEVAGQTILSTDPAVVAMRVAAPATATSPCSPGAWSASSTFYYVCVGVDTWRRVGLVSW